jgi:hypothetical protein
MIVSRLIVFVLHGKKSLGACWTDDNVESVRLRVCFEGHVAKKETYADHYEQYGKTVLVC